MPSTILTHVTISLIVVLVIAFTLVMLPVERQDIKGGLDFSLLQIEEDVGEKLHFSARDGAELAYRFYAGESDRVLVLVHGSGTEGRYLAGLANYISKNGIAQVIVPDLRGHGESVVSRLGDVTYLGQLEDDLTDLIEYVNKANPQFKIWLGGHSSGGGFVLKYGAIQNHHRIAGYLLLAPYLGHDAPTSKANSGEWVQVSVRRYIGLSILNKIGVTVLNNQDVMFFNRPKEWQDGLQADSYTYRMNESFAPHDYKTNLSKIKQPILVIIGQDDESLFAGKYKSEFASLAPQAEVHIVEDASHLDIVSNKHAYDLVKHWLGK